MRDRRNTNLSVTSTTSTFAVDTSPSSRTSMNEKRDYTPPLSPALPSLAMKGHTPDRPLRPRLMMALRCLLGLVTLFYLWRSCFASSAFAPGTHLVAGDGADRRLEIASNKALPEEPSVVMVADHSGQARWTVSIPPNRSFPLPRSQYRELCRQCEALQGTLKPKSRLFQPEDPARKHDFYLSDRTFLDIGRAQRIGALPKGVTPAASNASSDVCQRSLTFVLDEEEASFGKSLLMLWMSYGLAKRQGRAFFIDDSRWPYGSYASYFAPPPSPGCSLPAREHVVPCPHDAAHLLVSAATAPWTFGPSLDQDFLRSRVVGAEKGKRIYDLLRVGYKELFRLNGDDKSYASSRIASMRAEASDSDAPLVGIHVRRGDRHPVEYQFSRDYLPLERYVATAHSIRSSARSPALRERSMPLDAPVEDDAVREPLPLLLASDDPAVLAASELWQGAAPFTLVPAQQRIQLATKAALVEAGDSTSTPIGADVDAGWDGGFYKALFFSLGKPPQRHAGNTGRTFAVSEEGVRLRTLIGRAYLLDVAVLAQADAVVCAVSSATCRVLAVMMGWDAVRDGRWVNVDDGRPWSWDGRDF